MEKNLVIIKTKQNENKQNEKKETQFSVKKKFKIGRFLVNILYEK
jgi:hypothetical protein